MVTAATAEDVVTVAAAITLEQSQYPILYRFLPTTLSSLTVATATIITMKHRKVTMDQLSTSSLRIWMNQAVYPIRKIVLQLSVVAPVIAPVVAPVVAPVAVAAAVVVTTVLVRLVAVDEGYIKDHKVYIGRRLLNQIKEADT